MEGWVGRILKTFNFFAYNVIYSKIYLVHLQKIYIFNIFIFSAGRPLFPQLGEESGEESTSKPPKNQKTFQDSSKVALQSWHYSNSYVHIYLYYIDLYFYSKSYLWYLCKLFYLFIVIMFSNILLLPLLYGISNEN